MIKLLHSRSLVGDLVLGYMQLSKIRAIFERIQRSIKRYPRIFAVVFGTLLFGSSMAFLGKFVFAEKERHMYVFPTVVTDEGWEQEEKILRQDLSPRAYFSDFSSENSTYVFFGDYVEPISGTTTEGQVEGVATSTDQVSFRTPRSVALSHVERYPSFLSPLIISVAHAQAGDAEWLDGQPVGSETVEVSSTTQVETQQVIDALEKQDVALCETLGIPCHYIEIAGFGVEGELTDLPMTSASLQLSLGHVGGNSASANDRILVRASIDGEWQLVYEEKLGGEYANATHGGYLTLPLDISRWSQLATAKFVVEYVRESDASGAIYLDGAWIDVAYEDDRAIKDAALDDNTQATLAEADQIQSDARRDTLELPDGAKIRFQYGDTYPEQKLSIKVDQASYQTLERGVFYANVTNEGEDAEEVNLQFHIPNKSGSIVSVEEWAHDLPIKKAVRSYEPVGYFCSLGWEGEGVATTTEASRGEYRCAETSEVRKCDALNDDRTNCLFNDGHAEIVEEESKVSTWRTLPVTSGSYKADQGIFTRMISAIVSDLPQDIIPETRYEESHVVSPLLLERGETVYLRVEYAVALNSKGVMYLEASGASGSFGLKKIPWLATWEKKKTVTVEHDASALDLVGDIALEGIGDDFWGRVATSGEDVRIVSPLTKHELPFVLLGFDKTNQKGFIRAKIPASSATSSLFEIYYGNESAHREHDSASILQTEQLVPRYVVFSDSDQQDQVLVITARARAQVQVGDREITTLMPGEEKVYRDIANGEVVYANGAIVGTLDTVGGNGVLSPIAFGGKRFSVPVLRGEHEIAFTTLEANTGVAFEDSTASGTIDVIAETVVSNPLSENDATLFTAARTVSVVLRDNERALHTLLYPASIDDRYGLKQGVTSIVSGVTPSGFMLRCERGATERVEGRRAGAEYRESICVSGDGNATEALRVAGLSGEFSALSYVEKKETSALFLPLAEFDTEVGLLEDAPGVTAVCREGSVSDLAMVDSFGVVVATGKCEGRGGNPGKIYFDADGGSWKRGYRVVTKSATSSPFILFAYSKQRTDGTTQFSNVWSAIQSRGNDARVNDVQFGKELDVIHGEYRTLDATDSGDLKEHVNEILEEKREFSKFEKPTFRFRYHAQSSGLVQRVRDAFGVAPFTVRSVQLVHQSIGEVSDAQIDVAYGENNEWEVVLSEKNAKIRPGKYLLKVEIDEGDTTYADEFEFFWGVLAINTHRSMYVPGEKAEISIAALSNSGNTICDAHLRLFVTDNGQDEELPVTPSGKCNGNNVVDVPDYTATWVTHASGTYPIRLTRLDEEGNLLTEIRDQITVVDRVPYVIERVGPTRIYPLAQYDMRIRIRALEAFNGRVVERIPRDFVITERGNANLEYGEFGDITATWNVDLAVGEVVDMAYRFDAPNLTPYLFELGPIELLTDTSSFQEARKWQIASDAAGKMLIYWDQATRYIPTGWTCVSCTASDAFYDRLVIGSSTYGGIGGVATHTPTASATVYPTTATAVGPNTTNNFNNAIINHSHTFTPQIGGASTYPAYRELRVLQAVSAGEPASIPSGAILPFDVASSSLPSGWYRLDDIDGRYPRAASTTNVNGGAHTHTHTATGTLAATADTGRRQNGTNPSSALNTHTHTLSATNTNSVNHEPPYIEVLYARLAATSSPTNYIISMWDDTPPDGWATLSDVGGAFEGKFLKASTTYGGTGGGSTHQHADMLNATTSGPSTTANYGTNQTAQASGAHTHLVDITGFSTDTHLPPYIGAIFAKRLSGVSTYDQNTFRFYANTNALTPTDPWPTGGVDLAEDASIDSSGLSASISDVLRLRVGALVGNSTSTVGRDAFKLQYAAASDCALALNWNDVASTSSSTAKWRGYNNAGVANNTTLASTLLSTAQRAELYVEEGNSTGTPTQIGVGEVGEWDWVIQQNNADAGTNYCFRMTRSDGSLLDLYSVYPSVLTNAAPEQATLALPYNNEKIGTTTPIFYFTSSDTETNDLDYQIEVSTSNTFGSTVFAADSTTDPGSFENVPNPTNKAPFNSGDQIKIRTNTAFTNGTTYWWRVRAKDTNDSNTWGSWSALRSFTVDTSVTVSTWFQTTKEQFQTDTLVNTESTTTDQIMITSGNLSGLAYTSQIDFADRTSGTAWGSFAFSDDRTNGTMRYAVEYLSATGTWMLVPDSALSGNSSGFSASPISLLTVSPDIYTSIRLRATFTDSFGTPKLNDWTVSWGYNVETPTIYSPFDNAILATTTPQFEFLATDPQVEPLTYEVQISTSSAFTSSYTRVSDTHAGFTNVTYATDTNPFNSGERVRFWLQPADALTASTTYYWRVRAKDPTGANNYSFYTDTRSFTIGLSHRVAAWYQTTDDQWNTAALTSMETYNAGTLRVATATAEALIAYGEGTVQTPRYRIWDGSAWSSELSANSVGSQINWVVTRASPITGQYMLGTMGTDNDVNVQVYENGAWGNQMELTTSISNNRARGFDIAYETNSGRAVVVTCDGDADPTYRLWDGTSWAATGTVNITSTSNCEWIRLASNPISNEIMLLERNTGSRYEAQIWNATTSSWGNAYVIGGSMTEVAHEGMAAAYEKTGYQGVAVVSNGNNANFIWTYWNGGAWNATATFALQDDFEFGNLATSPTSDLLSLCYIDEDTDVGTVRWTGAAWVATTEHSTTAVSKNGRNIDCAYETSSGRSDYIMSAYGDLTALTTRYRFWNGATWSVAANISTAVQTYTDQLTRTATGTILGAFYDATNFDILFSSWNGATWSTLQTLEDNASVQTSPYGEPFFMAPKNPASRATVIGDPIDFDDGVAPAWKRVLWSDTENGGSSLLYQVQYLDASSTWQLVPDSEIAGNSSGTTTPPINISGLDSTTYNQIRLVGSASCFQGRCPYLNDWTVEWAQGVKISGTARLRDLTTATTSGTVAIAVNGTLQTGKTGTIGPSGQWEIDNVTVFPGNTITVFIQNPSTANRAVAVAKYTGSGDFGGLSLNQNWLTLGTASSSAQSISLSELSRYDNSVSGSNDLFHDVTAGGDLNVCNVSGCSNAGLYVLSGATFTPSTTTAKTINTYDLRIAGALSADANTIKVGGSWRNLGAYNAHTSTVVFNATSTTQSVDSTGAATSTFYNVTFGETGNTGIWNFTTNFTATGTVQVNYGTLSPANGAMTLQGDFTIGANGTFTKGNATTTLSGATTKSITDNTASKQDLGKVLIDGTAKTINLGSSIKVTDLTIGADDTLDAVSGNTITVLGNWVNGNTYTPRTSTVTFTATTTARVNQGASSFYNLTFNGSGGSFSFVGANATVTNDMTITLGTSTFPTGTLAVSGSFLNTGGSFISGSGIVRFTGNTGGKSIQVSNSSFANLEIAGVGGAWTVADTNATTTNTVNILTGTLVLPSGVFAVGGDITNNGGTLSAGSGTLRMYASSGSRTIKGGGSSFGTIEIGGAGNFAISENNATTTGDLRVLSGSLTFPYANFAIGGSFANSATFVAGTSTALFYGTTGTKSINPGSNSFSNVTINGAGDFVISGNATTTGAFSLLRSGTFVLNSGLTLSVGGAFTNMVGGSPTTWTGSTLFLNSGTSYTLNTKTQGGDIYGTIKTGAQTQVRMWNSSGSSYTMDTNGSLYSQNHASTTGALNVYGNYTRTSGVDYWSYATDFDGTALGGSSRQVNVLFGPNATTSYRGAQLEILGGATATTTIDRESTGNYAIELRGGTVNAQYYRVRNVNQFGLQLLASTTVTSLRDGDYELGVNGGSMLTIASSTIDANPAAQIFSVAFGTSTGISSGYNVTELGIPVSYWRFKQHSGNYDGENFDNDPQGNPGSVRWDDSNFVITISGNVYSDAGVTPMGGPTCDNVTSVVRVRVDGAGNFAAPCNPATGAFSVSGVTFTGDTVMTIYLDTNGGANATYVTRSAVSDISGVKLYQNRVIVSHEDTSPMSIALLDAYDYGNDTDVPFTVTLGSPNTLVTRPDTEFWIWAGKTFVPNGNVTTQSGGSGNTFDGSFHIDNSATFTGATGETHSVGGRFVADSGATFTSGSSLFNFTATTTNKSITGLSTLAFGEVRFTGAGGEWSINSAITISGNLVPSQGRIVGTGNVTVAGTNVTGAGVIALSGGTFTMQNGGMFGGTSDWSFANLTLSGTGGTTTKTASSSVTVSGVFTISAQHVLYAGTSTQWILSGTGSPFVQSGTFIRETSVFKYSGQGATTINPQAYYRLILAPTSTAPTYTIGSGNLAVLDILSVGDGSNTVTVNGTTNDPSMTLYDDLVIQSGGVFVASDSATLRVAGDWLNQGTFTHSNGTVLLNATSTGRTVTPGNSSFGNLSINAAGGGWTILSNATTSGALSLSNATSFTQTSGTTLEVRGTFTNDVGGSATTWTGSTLYLNSGTTYALNTKATGTDTYDRLEVGANTDVSMWNSSASTTVVSASGSLYSQDHAAVDGSLYVWGDYQRSTGTDYWDYAYDFDGVALGGSARQVNVRFASSSSYTLSGSGALEAIGTSSATTTIDRQSAGVYTFNISGGSTTLQFNRFRNVDSSGLNFSGSPTVNVLNDNDFLLEINSGSMITVAGATIDANPLRTFSRNYFSTSTGITTGNNVRATGSSASAWRFAGDPLVYGNYAGESHDSDPGGDPGYIIWDDSAARLTISGNVYSDEGVTPIGGPTCNGVTQNVKLVVQGGTTYTSACNGTTGAYSISNINYNPLDTIIVYLDTGGGARAANVIYDPVTNIGNAHLYQDRVIVRHEQSDPITIAKMVSYDVDQDTDIPFNATVGSPNSLVVRAGAGLIVWDSKTFSPAGNVTLHANATTNAWDGTLHLNADARFIAQSTETHTLGGQFLADQNAALVASSGSIFNFNATTTGKLIAASSTQAFGGVTFNGSGGGWIGSGIGTTTGNMTLTLGAVTFPASTMDLAGSFTTTGGTFNANGGAIRFVATSSGKTISANGSAFNDLSWNGIGGAWTMTDTNATSTGNVTVASGTVAFTPGTFAVRGDLRNTGGVFTQGGGTLKLYAPGTTASIQLNGSSLANLEIAGTSTFNFVDTNATSTGNIVLSLGTTVFPTGTLGVYGSFTNNALFTAGSSTLLLSATTGSKTINVGNSSLYNMSFSGAGTFTVSANATATNAIAINAAGGLTVSSGVTLAAGGVFTNLVGGGATTWTGSTLSLYGTGSYTMNTKTLGGDVYDTLRLSDSVSVRSWNSSATTVATFGTSSLYSQNNAASSGSLYIYGNYTRSSGSDYWSYATDFDGTSLGGSSRVANVRFAPNATATWSGGATLQMLGISTASTTVDRQSTGNYALILDSAILNAQYYQLRNMDRNGLKMVGATTITMMNNGDLELGVSGGSLMSIASSTLDQNASTYHSAIRFATSTGILAGANVTRLGTSTGAITFQDHTGNIAGESYDNDGTDACGQVRWSDSSCLFVDENHYRFRYDNGGEAVPNSEWYDTSWTRRKRVRVMNNATSTYTNVQVKIPVAYDADMKSDFSDLRFTDNSGTTSIPFWIAEDTISSASTTVWVKVPSLPASSYADVFMYYGNSGAANTGTSGTSTFKFFDDFEDGNISEYSGDATLFANSTSYNYERTYGIAASPGNTGSQNTSGIAQVSAGVGRDTTFRFHQYIDMTTGGSDEPCFMFAVQSPITLHQNYAACLSPFGVDKLIIAKNVAYNSRSATELATTTLTYTTGWYEVNVDWFTSGRIDARVYDATGAFVASTTAVDTTYSSGGVGFTYWGMHGGWDIPLARAYYAVQPSVTFGLEQLSGGASWKSAEDTALTNQLPLENVRVRFSVKNSGGSPTTKNYRLQVASKGASPNCESVPTGNYTDVPTTSGGCGSSVACMTSSTQFSDKASSTQLLSLASGFNFAYGQIMEDPSNQSGNVPLNNNESTEVEYNFQLTAFANQPAYCMRATDAGTALDNYSRVAEVRPLYAPVISGWELNSNSTIALTEGTTTRIYASGTVSDLNGYTDIIAASSTFFRSGVSNGRFCTADANNCYQVATSSCQLSSCSGNSCALSCAADLQYFADPTDAVSTYAAQIWDAFVDVWDNSGTHTTASSTQDVYTLSALSIPSAINYGSVTVGGDTGTSNASTSVTNTGNKLLDLNLGGDNLRSGVSQILYSYQKYATSTFTYSSCSFCNTLAASTTPSYFGLGVPKPTSTTAVYRDIFWGLGVPLGVSATTHNGVNEFLAY